VTNLSDLRYFNLSTGENIRWTNTWAANDVVIFDGGSLAQPLVTRNNEPQDFEGKLPKNQTGKNRLQMKVVTTANVKITQDSFNNSDNFFRSDFFSGKQERKLAQSWQCTQTGTLTEVKVRMNVTVSGLSAGVSIEIRSNSAGNPGAVLASTSISSTSGFEVISVPFSLGITTGTTYWIVTSASGSETTTAEGDWSEDTTQPYASGLGKVSTDGGTTWSNTSSDFYFEVSQEPTPSTDIDWSCSYRKLYY
jgi:hypothetical protein